MPQEDTGIRVPRGAPGGVGGEEQGAPATGGSAPERGAGGARAPKDIEGS